MKTPVPPFLVPREDLVTHRGWQLRSPDGALSPLPIELEHWDYQTVLELVAVLDFDPDAVAAASGLEPRSVLTVVVMGRSQRTRVERAVGRFDVKAGANMTTLELSLHGQEFGGRLSLETLLVASEPRPLSPLAATQPGSVLWRSVQNVHLEGVGAQFPTDTADFTLKYPDSASAAWTLTVDTSDPDALFLSAVRLTLNTSQSSVQKMVTGRTDDTTEMLRRVLEWDVTRQLAVAAFSTDGVLDADYDPEATSVSGVLRNHLSRIWPAESMDTLRSWWETDRRRIERNIQDHCGFAG